MILLTALLFATNIFALIAYLDKKHEADVAWRNFHRAEASLVSLRIEDPLDKVLPTQAEQERERTNELLRTFTEALEKYRSYEA